MRRTGACIGIGSRWRTSADWRGNLCGIATLKRKSWAPRGSPQAPPQGTPPGHPPGGPPKAPPPHKGSVPKGLSPGIPQGGNSLGIIPWWCGCPRGIPNGKWIMHPYWLFMLRGGLFFFTNQIRLASNPLPRPPPSLRGLLAALLEL